MVEEPVVHAVRAQRRRGGGVWLLAGLVALLAAGGGLWLSANFERQTREVSVGASAAARADPFLAAARFLADSGLDARSAAGSGLLQRPPAPADMLVVDGLPALTRRRREGLRDWLTAGGRLLVTAVDAAQTAAGPEPFLAQFGAALRRDADPGAGDEVLARLRIDGYPRALTVGFAPGRYLADRSGAAEAQIITHGRPRLLKYVVGAGILYVVSDSRWLSNAHIGRHDHALLLALLAADRETVWLLHAASVPSLPALLWQAAPAALLSAALLLGLLLWHAGRRLGPLLPAPDTARRDLLEHLQAAGDFLWRQNRGNRLVAQTRRRLQRRWLRRQPALLHLDEAGRAHHIAAQTGLSPAAVRAALYGPVEDAADLVRITVTLQRLLQAHPSGAAPRHQHPATGSRP
ncbi:DUF4350 domain-containing protein [uncultured Thiohalocapsa sp.]|uniref:DUF4350 domain-containing protein n=1 Tax=uncultured Thiohalocapsa sp. TaxID=768990 RepID=UPI0025D25AB3|nr:DUF4350 domain-containing protein [uncultured Thiohalocapsa sp.]